MADDAVTARVDLPTLMELGEEVAVAAEAADGPLIVYYVGHGLVSSTGELHLAASKTDSRSTRVEHTALPYAMLRRYLRDSKARPLVVILDCCFSGKAVAGLDDPDDQIANLSAIRGAVVLTSAGREELAFAHDGEPYTVYSGALLRLLEHGDPSGPRALTLREIHRHLARVLPAAGYPRPRIKLTEEAGELVLTSNPAYQPSASAADGTTDPSDGDGWVDVCPYKGLTSFEPEDSRFFFGRDRATSDLLSRLADRYDDAHPVIMTGASGAGKSSLLRAGLIPAIARGGLQVAGSVRWPRLLLTPTRHPIEELARRLAELVHGDIDEISMAVSADPDGLPDILYTPLRETLGTQEAARARTVIVVDQFEEIFSECEDEAEREAFIRAICAAATGNGGRPAALVALGLRADFYARCAAYPQLRAALEGRQIVLGPMTAAELRAAIARPAAEAGLVLEPGLVELLLRDLGIGPEDKRTSAEHSPTGYDAGKLPLLSHALLATWQQRRGRTMTIEAYQRTGGIHGALAATADRALAGLDDAGRQAAPALLRRLVHVADGTEDTRRRVDRDRLIAEMPQAQQAQVEPVLQAFAAPDARLITIGQGVVEITHEALLRAWPTLHSWIKADRAGLVVQQQLTDAAIAWDGEGRDPAGLYRGTKLALARDWADSRGRENLAPLAREFLTASVENELHGQRIARRRKHVGVAISIVISILAVVAFGAAIRASNATAAASEAARVANKQRAVAEAQHRVATVRGLIAEADSIQDKDPETAIRLGMAALALDKKSGARASLVPKLLKSRQMTAWGSGVSKPYIVALSRDGHTAFIGGQNRKATVWDISDHRRPRRLSTLNKTPKGLSGATFSPNGHLVLMTDHHGTGTLWDFSDIKKPHRQGRLYGAGGGGVFAPDGRTLLTTGSALGQVATVWDISNPSRPRHVIEFPRWTYATGSIAYHPDGHTVLTTGGSRGATLWNLSDPRRPRVLAHLKNSTGPTGGFSPDGRLAFIEEAWGNIEIWNVTDPARPRLKSTLPESGDSDQEIWIAPGNKTLVKVGSATGMTKWNIGGKSEPERIEVVSGPQSALAAAELTRDGRIALTVHRDGRAGLWNLAERSRHPLQITELNKEPESTDVVALSPDNDRVLTYSTIGKGDQGRLRLWNLTKGHSLRVQAEIRGLARVRSAKLMPDGRSVVVGIEDKGVELWDVGNHSQPERLANFGKSTNDIDFTVSPDGRLLLTNTFPRPRLWDITDRTKPRRIAFLGGDARVAAFSNDNHLLVTGGGDRTVTLWDVSHRSRPRAIKTLRGQAGGLMSAAFSQNGKILVTASTDWRTDPTFDDSDLRQDGEIVGPLIVWDVSNPAKPHRLAALTSHTGDVTGSMFSADGRILATSGEDEEVIYWDITVPKHPYRLFSVQKAAIWPPALAFTSNGRTGLIAVPHGVGYLVSVDMRDILDVVDDPLKYGCQIAGRGLNKEEWQSYAPGLPYEDNCAH